MVCTSSSIEEDELDEDEDEDEVDDGSTDSGSFAPSPRRSLIVSGVRVSRSWDSTSSSVPRCENKLSAR